MKNKIKTKIVCTIGPSSWDREILEKMINNGMTVARVNGAFADLDELNRVAKTIRSISTEVALMIDIKGHQVRLNKFEAPIPLSKGKQLILGSKESDAIFPVTYPNLYKDLKVGDKLLFDDGNVDSEVVEIKDGNIYLKILFGEVLKPAKSVNVPGIKLSNPVLTSRDIEQIDYCAENGWDYIAASFIRTVDDVRFIKTKIKNSDIRIIAKIEDKHGIDNIDEILKEVEGIMIARGDMGVELPFEQIPLIQKTLIKKCNLAGKSVITATHMLESMIDKPRPTRAEITDVANAIWDGTDAIMTSGETSGGKFPVESISTMKRIALEVEKMIEPTIMDINLEENSLAKASTRAAFEVCNSINIDAVIVVGNTGNTAQFLGAYKIKQPIIAFVSTDSSRRRLQLYKGITTTFVYKKEYKDRDSALNSVINEVVSNKLVGARDRILIIGSASKNGTKFPNIFEVIDLKDFDLS